MSLGDEIKWRINAKYNIQTLHNTHEWFAKSLGVE